MHKIKQIHAYLYVFGDSAFLSNRCQMTRQQKCRPYIQYIQFAMPLHMSKSLTQSISMMPSYWMEGHSKLKILSTSFKPDFIKNQAEVSSSLCIIKLGL